MSTPQPKLTVGKFQFLPACVKITGRPKLDEWAAPLQFALWCQRASPWWIGDLLNAGDDGFGEFFSQICEGYISGDQLQRYESIARRVPAENRNENLSWSAHAAVARLPRNQQKAMLDLAEENGWTSEQLRRYVREQQLLVGKQPSRTSGSGNKVGKPDSVIPLASDGLSPTMEPTDE